MQNHAEGKWTQLHNCSFCKTIFALQLRRSVFLAYLPRPNRPPPPPPSLCKRRFTTEERILCVVTRLFTHSAIFFFCGGGWCGQILVLFHLRIWRRTFQGDLFINVSIYKLFRVSNTINLPIQLFFCEWTVAGAYKSCCLEREIFKTLFINVSIYKSYQGE